MGQTDVCALVCHWLQSWPGCVCLPSEHTLYTRMPNDHLHTLVEHKTGVSSSACNIELYSTHTSLLTEKRLLCMFSGAMSSK